ncbi:hypothetical protein STEG23_033894, partial [Scotinomys teguina]
FQEDPVQQWTLSTQTEIGEDKGRCFAYMYIHHMCLKVLDLLELELQMNGCEPPCRCWELNSDPRSQMKRLS